MFLPAILQRLRSDASEPGTVFYSQDQAEPMEVAMMRSRGEFRTAFSDAHKAQIIELPYEVRVTQETGEETRRRQTVCHCVGGVTTMEHV